MRAAWAWLAVTLAVSLLAAAPLEPVEAAAPADAVAERYEAGKAALAAGRFEDALAAFEAAEGLATDEVTRWQVLLGLGGYGISTLLWMYCLSKLPLRVVYPYTALTFVLVVAGAVLIFGERAGWRAGAGTLLVLGGLLMIMWDRT